MNERIKLLAKQAYEDVIENSPSFLVTKELYEQKFAELIVKECTEVILNTPVQYIAIDDMHRIRDNVKEHFGVEE